MFDGKTDFRTRSTTGNKNAGLTLLDMRHYVLMLEHGFVKQTALALNMNANYMRGSISALNKIAGRPLFTEEWRGIYGRRVDATPFGLALYAIFKDIIIRWDNCMHLLEAVAPKDYQLAHKCTYGTPFDVDGNWQSQLLELFPGVFDGERGFDIQVAVAESNPFPVGVV